MRLSVSAISAPVSLCNQRWNGCANFLRLLHYFFVAVCLCLCTSFSHFLCDLCSVSISISVCLGMCVLLLVIYMSVPALVFGSSCLFVLGCPFSYFCVCLFPFVLTVSLGLPVFLLQRLSLSLRAHCFSWVACLPTSVSVSFPSCSLSLSCPLPPLVSGSSYCPSNYLLFLFSSSAF